MEFRVHLDQGARLVVAELSGPLDLPAMRDTVRAVIACPGSRPTDGLLSDHTRIAAPITPPDLAAFLDFLELESANLRQRKWAIVVASPASFGMMRALSVGASRIPLDVEVFTDMADARAWLAEPAVKAD